jgi:hypothetical protein
MAEEPYRHWGVCQDNPNFVAELQTAFFDQLGLFGYPTGEDGIPENWNARITLIHALPKSQRMEGKSND